MKRTSFFFFFLVLVLECVVDLHSTDQLQLLRHQWLGHRLGLLLNGWNGLDVEWFGISELKWTGMGEFNSDGHCIYNGLCKNPLQEME